MIGSLTVLSHSRFWKLDLTLRISITMFNLADISAISSQENKSSLSISEKAERVLMNVCILCPLVEPLVVDQASTVCIGSHYHQSSIGI